MIFQNDLALQWRVIEPAVVEAVRRVGSSGWYILGPEVDRFETALFEHWGDGACVGVGTE